MSTLTVQTLQAPTSGANANKVLIPSGHTLDASSGSVDASNGLTTPAGHVIQTVTGTFTTDTVISTGGYTSIGSLAITPNFANSKILISSTNHIYLNSGTASQWRAANFKLFRDSSAILTGEEYDSAIYSNSANTRFMLPSTVNYHDTPNTTNAVTYSIQYNRRNSDTTNIIVNHSSYGRQGFMSLQEIAQ